MFRTLMLAGALSLAPIAVAAAQEAGPTDAQIAHIAYTAGQLDIDAARQALEKSTNPEVRAFAELMARDHAAVNEQAVALVTRLQVTPEANPISVALSEAAAATHARLEALDGAAFDAAYVANEAAFHKTVNTALGGTLIPQADNAELKSLLETGLALFQSHQTHAEHLARSVR
jgi:putative membrane protein